jgi:rubrerythrin
LNQTASVAEVNRGIRRIAGEADPVNRLTWEFVCECGACNELVGLALAHYDELRSANVLILAAGHVVRRARKNRQRSSELREDANAIRDEATALQNQARHQLGRAGRIAEEIRWPSIEFRCTKCGYGAVTISPPRQCPLCRSNAWYARPPRSS